MPNILLTTRCNLACQYCFAQEKLVSSRMNMPIENVQRVIDFLKRSEFPIFRVMGGEPTLHPRFNEIIQMAIQEGLRVDVLSNATWAESTGALFARIPPKNLMFLLNINHPDNYTPIQWATIERNLAGLKGRGGITLSFNVFEKQPRSEYILDLAQRYEIKYIRLSLSLPVLGVENAYLPFDDLQGVAPFVMRFAAEAEAKGISVRFDNAVPLCIFNEAQIGNLLLHSVYDLNRNIRCNPIIDIGPDLTIWSCFCLSSLKNRHLEEFETLADAQAYYHQVWSVYQDVVYPLEKCSGCFYREKWGCQGGCLSYMISKDQGQRYAAKAKPGLEPALVEPEYVLGMADDVRIFHYDYPQSSLLLRKMAVNLDLEVQEVFQPVIPLLDGQHTLAEIMAAFSGSPHRSDPLHAFMNDVVSESVPEFLQALLRQGFLKQTLTSAPAAYQSPAYFR